MFVNRDSIRMDDSKVKAIMEWPAPTTVRSVRSFLGLTNFYRRFIKDYTTLVKPLMDLTQKDKAFTWGSLEANMFASLKSWFTTTPILAYPDNDCQFRLETDASDFATGAVLSILKNDKWHPVAFSSHVISPEERNYPVVDKEMLLVIHALEQWCHYLEGAKHQFDIWNDHTNLQWFMKRQDLNHHQVQWAQYLSRFSFLWTHKAGSTMGKVDALFCCKDHTVGVADNNKGVTVIPPSQVRSLPLIDDIRKKYLMLWSHRLKQRSTVYARRKGSARNMTASSMIPPVRCTSPMMILCTCTSSLLTMTPLLPVTRAIKKPKNSLKDNIIGPGWPRTYDHTCPSATVAHASKEGTQSLLALLYHFSQARCLGWTSVWTSSQIFHSPTALTLSLQS